MIQQNTVSDFMGGLRREPLLVGFFYVLAVELCFRLAGLTAFSLALLTGGVTIGYMIHGTGRDTGIHCGVLGFTLGILWALYNVVEFTLTTPLYEITLSDIILSFAGQAALGAIMGLIITCCGGILGSRLFLRADHNGAVSKSDPVSRNPGKMSPENAMDSSGPANIQEPTGTSSGFVEREKIPAPFPVAAPETIPVVDGVKQRATAGDIDKKTITGSPAGPGSGADTRQVPECAPAKNLPSDRLSEIAGRLSEIVLVDSANLGNAGPGGSVFQTAIQELNQDRYADAEKDFEKAVNLGLDPLRQGYSYAVRGEIKIRQEDPDAAVRYFLRVFENGQILYESADTAAKYLTIICRESGFEKEARDFESLARRTSAKLGYTLAPEAAERVRLLVRSRGGLSGKTVQADEVKMKPYTNKKWDLSLRYPETWKILWENEPDGGWEIIVGVTGKPSRSGQPVVSIRVLQNAVLSFAPKNVAVFAAGGPGMPVALPRTPEEYNKRCRQELKEALPCVRFISEETGTLAGIPSGTLLYDYKSKTGTIREKQINLFGTHVTYRLLCEAPEEQSESVEKYFDTVVKDFALPAGGR